MALHKVRTFPKEIMASKIRLSLSEKFVLSLGNLPESGMGYQIVDIKLINGEVLFKRIVINSSLLELENEGEVKNEDIKEIILSTN